MDATRLACLLPSSRRWEQQEKNDINEVFYKQGMQLLEDVIESRGISKEEIMDSLNQVSVLNYFNAKSAE